MSRARDRQTDEKLECVRPSTAVVSVIGCAGRRSDAIRMTFGLYNRMVDRCRQVISGLIEPGGVHLVSGGAAWSDHIAVTLFLSGEFAGLTLHLPCQLTAHGFAETSSSHWAQNPGRLANMLHRQFSEKLGRDTLRELNEARERGARIEVHNGFHARNNKVAQSPYLIAFSWGENGSPPRDGGTRYTWDRAHGTCVHVSLHDL